MNYINLSIEEISLTKEKEAISKMFFAYQQDKFYTHSVRSHSDKFQRGIPLGAHFPEGNGIPWGICLHSLSKHAAILSSFILCTSEQNTIQKGYFTYT